MKSIIQTKSLADIKTIISRHIRSTPRQNGTVYLDILSQGMEKLRLEAEMDWIDRRRKRIEARLAEIGQTMSKLMTDSREELSNSSYTAPSVSGDMPSENSAPEDGHWKKMSIEY